LKKVSKVWVFESKNPVFGSKSSEKFRKKFGKVWKLGFLNVRKFRKLFFSELSENYEKMMLNSNFGNREKLVLTRKPVKSSECRALVLSNRTDSDLQLFDRLRHTPKLQSVDCITVYEFLTKVCFKAGAGNYFRLQASLCFYLCLAGQIHVKYAFSKLKLEPSRAGCGLWAIYCPFLL